MSAVPLVLAFITTSTASAWQTAGARWERLALEEAAAHDLTRARLRTKTASHAAVRAALDLGILSRDRTVLQLQLELNAERSRGPPKGPIVTTAVCVGGLVAGTLGVALCRDAGCRSTLGLGGAGVAAVGCGITWWDW